MNNIKSIRTAVSDIKEISIVEIRNKIQQADEFRYESVSKAFVKLEEELDKLEFEVGNDVLMTGSEDVFRRSNRRVTRLEKLCIGENK